LNRRKIAPLAPAEAGPQNVVRENPSQKKVAPPVTVHPEVGGEAGPPVPHRHRVRHVADRLRRGVPQTPYIDKPMRTHTLMQAIARANCAAWQTVCRPFKHSPALLGLVILTAKKAMPAKEAGQTWPLRAYLAKKSFNFSP
jgi:hypothetical protein